MNVVRVSNWWNYLTPFLLGIACFIIYSLGISFATSIKVLALLFVTIAGTAAFGYFLNDITDIETDRRAGKRNLAAANSGFKNFLILFLLLAIALLPWLLIPNHRLNFPLYLVQLLLLVVYSVRPIRLKRFPVPGSFTDALYNTVVPLWVISTTFLIVNSFREIFSAMIPVAMITAWAFLKGFRGILLHQLGDRKNDRKSSLNTFVVHYGPLYSLKLLFNFTIWIEILLFAGIIVYISIEYIPFLYLVFPLFLIYLFLFFRLWENFAKRRKELRVALLFVINDLYEEWLPLIILIYLCIRNPQFLILLFFYLVIFNKIIFKFYQNTRKNLRNFSDFRQYFVWKMGKYLKSIIKR